MATMLKALTPKLMSLKEAHEYFGISIYALRKGVKSGRIKHAVVGRTYMIDVDALQHQLDIGENILE